MKRLEQIEQLGALTQGALRHQVVRRLLNAIFQGDLTAGTRLIVMRLAAQLGLSSTPVREALVELEAVGMIKFWHNRGAIVKPFTAVELREVYQIRRIFEQEACRSACGRIDPKVLESLQTQMKRLLQGRYGKQWVKEEMSTDRRLHEVIAAACGNTRLAEEIHRYDTLVQALRDVVGRNQESQIHALKDHLTILEALLAGDAAEAAAAMGRHIDHAAEYAAAALFTKKD
ncbi:MAG: GntR family transcriptional regulator [Pirellulales bacterium]|nr:GntR family transcriptional regulator [Pirellulales bacterium]